MPAPCKARAADQLDYSLTRALFATPALNADWIAFDLTHSYLSSVPPLIDPNSPSESTRAPVTPRWQRRHLGVSVVLLLMAGLAWTGWHYKQRVPLVPIDQVPRPADGLR